MGFPALDIALTNNPVAFVITPANALEVRKINLIHSKFFMIKEWGLFEVDPTKAIRYNKQSVYFFDARHPKPLDPRLMSEIENWANSNKLQKVSRKDLRHGVMLRKMGIKRAIEQEEKAKAQIHAYIEEINQKLEQTNTERLQKGETPINISPEDYSDFVIENLISKSLITRPEALTLKVQLLKGDITFEQFLYSLEELKTINITQPVSMTSERYLEYFHAYDPAKVAAFIDRAEAIGDKIKKMGTPAIKNLLPMSYIVMMVFGAIIVGAVFSGLDFENLESMVPSVGSLTGGADNPDLVSNAIPDIIPDELMPGEEAITETEVEQEVIETGSLKIEP